MCILSYHWSFNLIDVILSAISFEHGDNQKISGMQGRCTNSRYENRDKATQDLNLLVKMHTKASKILSVYNCIQLCWGSDISYFFAKPFSQLLIALLRLAANSRSTVIGNGAI